MDSSLGSIIQNTLKSTYSPTAEEYNTENLVGNFRNLYDSADRTERIDIMIPFSPECLDDPPIELRTTDTGEMYYDFKYQWNRNHCKKEHNEFVSDPSLKFNVTIPQGQILDRLGSDQGRFVSPVTDGDSPYPADMRALPYYFVEPCVTKEPSYHKYVVINEISIDAIIQAIDNNQQMFKDEESKMVAMIKAQEKGIINGTAAPVPAFGVQGKGGCEQYQLPVSIHFLKNAGFLRELPSPKE